MFKVFKVKLHRILVGAKELKQMQDDLKVMRAFRKMIIHEKFD